MQQQESVSGALTAAQRTLLLGLPLMITLAFCGAYSVVKMQGYNQEASRSTSALRPMLTQTLPVAEPLPVSPLPLAPVDSTTNGVSVTSSTAIGGMLHDGDPQTTSKTSLQQTNDGANQLRHVSSTLKKTVQQDGNSSSKKSNSKTDSKESKH